MHFVVPFLRALGWPPERIAVKWRYIDVAVFMNLPRTAENCHLVIEAKRLGAGVEGALEQAKAYVNALGIPRDVIVTDGIRYRMYASGRGFEPVAYANLVRLKKPSSRAVRADAETLGDSEWSPGTRSRRRARKFVKAVHSIRTSSQLRSNKSLPGLHQRITGSPTNSLPALASHGPCGSMLAWCCAASQARPRTPRRCSR